MLDTCTELRVNIRCLSRPMSTQQFWSHPIHGASSIARKHNGKMPWDIFNLVFTACRVVLQEIPWQSLRWSFNIWATWCTSSCKWHTFSPLPQRPERSAWLERRAPARGRSSGSNSSITAAVPVPKRADPQPLPALRHLCQPHRHQETPRPQSRAWQPPAGRAQRWKWWYGVICHGMMCVCVRAQCDCHTDCVQM